MLRSAFRATNIIARRSALSTSLISTYSTQFSNIVHKSPVRFITESGAPKGAAITSSAYAKPSINNDTSDKDRDAILQQIPAELLRTPHPRPVRNEFIDAKKPLTTKDLEKIDIKINLHREPVTFKDKIAYTVVKLLRIPTDMFFKKKYIHRSVMLETVAAVPGMVGATLRHLRSLRRMKHDGGWIEHLLHEAENERMHLLTWMRFSQPNLWERGLVAVVQGVWYNVFFVLYLISPSTAHRVTGYLEEEAVISYTSFLKEIDNGNIQNIREVPEIALEYWKLDRNTATLRDVVLAVRADEAVHRDSNHHFSDRLILHREDLREDIKLVIAEEVANKRNKNIAGLNHNANEKWAH
ncbi:hypothetical protein G9A89_021135 [Geosiphon pyriformis]|nr:hypothetical protein G9A89_021135 [Geosiphon pyriformis]